MNAHQRRKKRRAYKKAEFKALLKAEKVQNESAK